MGLREANQRFSKAIRAVRDGEEVILTERGKPIAVISPLGERANVASIVIKLEQSGLLRPAAKHKPLPPWKPRRIAGKPLSRTVQEDRERTL
ncbi:MAG: type II toxin-antitoxin system Phd/YefM family antitoxin [Candidatus Binatia bacterium]